MVPGWGMRPEHPTFHLLSSSSNASPELCHHQTSQSKEQLSTVHAEGLSIHPHPPIRALQCHRGLPMDGLQLGGHPSPQPIPEGRKKEGKRRTKEERGLLSG